MSTPTPSSPSTSISIPSSPKFPWIHQPDQARNFSPKSPLTPRRTAVPGKNIQLDAHSDVHLTSSNHHGYTSGQDKDNGQGSDKNREMSVVGTQSPIAGTFHSLPTTIGSYRQRAFHYDQPYPSFAKPHKQPLELPPPTSPTRRRSFASLQGNWLYVLFGNVKRTRLLSVPSTCLALYFTLNLSLTLYNKSLLIHFPFPYTLSALHALCGTIGSFILVHTGSSPLPRLNARETLILFAFSCLYTVNIIVSNVSLGLVTVPFHQVIRASTPLFTILFSAIILGTRSSRRKLIALLPVVAGVGLATYGDYYFTKWGFFLTLMGTVLAALKTIYTNLLQKPSSTQPTPYTNYKGRSEVTLSAPRLPPLTPLHLLHLLSPLAFIQTTLIAHFSGELDRVWEYSIAGLRHPSPSGFTRGQPITSGLSNTQLALLVMNGVMAFGLNVVSFSANRKVGALSMTVAANVKQVLTILCAVALFNLTITPTNAMGIALTLIGGAVYATVELKERRERLA